MTRRYALPVAWIGVWIMFAHLVAPPSYSWFRHSISQLAAQGYALAPIMRVGFIGFGVLTALVGFSRMRGDASHWYREVPIILYGLAILGSGICSTSPFLPDVPYAAAEAQLHTMFATAAGVALSAAMLLFALTDPPTARRLLHLGALGLVLLLSAVFGTVPDGAGAIQRVLWLVGFGWLVALGAPPCADQPRSSRGPA